MTQAPGALERCVGDAAAFASEWWGRRPRLHRAEPGAAFDELLSAADVDRLFTASGLRVPAFRLVKDGTPLDARTYTRPARTGGVAVTGLADPVKVQRHFAEGATLVLQGLQRFWPPLGRFCRELEWALGHPTQVNAYVTPAGARGLAVHEDAHDVFVLQSFGSKRWRVWETGAGVAAARDGEAEPVIDAVLEPGDTLYLPRATPHAAEAQGAVSGHLTIGILATTWLDVIRRALAGVEPDEDLGEPLPVGFHLDRSGLAAAAEDRLKSLRARVERIDAEEVAAAEARRFLTSRPPLVAGGLLDAMEADTLDDGSPVRRRPGSFCVLQDDPGGLRVLLGDRELRMPARLRPAMDRVAAAPELTPADLSAHLDPAGRLTLIRRLVREGLLEVAR
ncbi:MAG: cupin domain-containing protein [Actinobacteria bacterium]|nr:cupin domain-containing protein [Actinomycetota bacterium]